MSLWEYKILSSSQLDLKSLSLLEAFLNGLGKEQWEIVSWQTSPGDPLKFEGLARRPTLRDWFPETSALKEKSQRGPAPLTEVAPPTAEEEAEAERAWKRASLKEVIETIRPRLHGRRKGERSASVQQLARSFKEGEAALIEDLEESGIHAPAGAAEKGDAVGWEGEDFWLERDEKGQLWLRARSRGQPAPARAPAEPKAEAPPRQERRTQERRAQEPASPLALLESLRRRMRKNRRGGGFSGSISFLARALHRDEADLLHALEGEGLGLPAGVKPPVIEQGSFFYWLNRNQGGQVWLNARDKARGAPEPAATAATEEGRAAAEPVLQGTPAHPAAAPEPALLSWPELCEKLPDLLEKQKRGTGSSAPLPAVAAGLNLSEEALVRELTDQGGLVLPAEKETKAKPVAHGALLFWLERDPEGALRLHARQKPKRRTGGKKPPAAEKKK